MAVIMQMRKRAGLLVALIALAIVSFLLMDVWNSQVPQGGPQESIGRVNGMSINQSEFAQLRAFTEDKYRYYTGYLNQRSFDPYQQQQISDLAWNEILEDKLLEDTYESLGLDVSEEEMSFAIYGNPSAQQPPVQEIQQFYNQYFNDGTGFNAQRLRDYLSGIGNRNTNDQQYGAYQRIDAHYQYLQNDIRRRLKQQKFSDLFQRTVYVPDWMARQTNEWRNQKVDMRYISLPYASLSDSLYKPTDSQLKDYLAKHAKEYKQEASRDIRFVLFDAFPTPEDTAAIMQKVMDLFEQFKASDNDSSFINRFSEPEEYTPAYNSSYFFEEDIPLDIVDTLFTAEPNSYFGPYEQSGRFHITKLIDRQEIPDSVHVRHLIIQYRSAEQTHKDSTYAKLDTAIQLYRAGTPWDTLVARYSDEKRENGDLGWWRPTDNYLRQLKDAVFIGTSVGDTFRIQSPNGVHFFQVMDMPEDRKPAVRFADLQRRIEPSEQTREAANRSAKKFMMKAQDLATFDTVAASMGFTARIATKLAPNAVDIPLIDVPARPMVRWAFNEPVGTVALFGPGDLLSPKYVVAIVEYARAEGTPELDEVRDDITPKVTRELKKEALLDNARTALAGSSTIDDVASKLGVSVAEAVGVSLEGRLVQGLGAEPTVAAAAQAAKPGQLSIPVAGNNGVVVFVVQKVNPAPGLPDYSQLVYQLSSQIQGRLGYRIHESMRESAKVKDERYRQL